WATKSISAFSVVGHLRLVDQHHRYPVTDRVAAPAHRADQAPALVVIGELAVVDGTHEQRAQFGIDHLASSITSRTSATSLATASSSGPSTLSRSSGSVLEGRRLNHRSSHETVSPSSRSWSASAKWDVTASTEAA